MEVHDRIFEQVKNCILESMKSLTVITALPPTSDKMNQLMLKDEDFLLVPIDVVRSTVKNSLPLTGALGRTLLTPQQMMERFGPWLKNWKEFISDYKKDIGYFTKTKRNSVEVLFNILNYFFKDVYRKLLIDIIKKLLSQSTPASRSAIFDLILWAIDLNINIDEIGMNYLDTAALDIYSVNQLRKKTISIIQNNTGYFTKLDRKVVDNVLKELIRLFQYFNEKYKSTLNDLINIIYELLNRSTSASRKIVFELIVCTIDMFSIDIDCVDDSDVTDILKSLSIIDSIKPRVAKDNFRALLISIQENIDNKTLTVIESTVIYYGEDYKPRISLIIPANISIHDYFKDNYCRLI